MLVKFPLNNCKPIYKENLLINLKLFKLLRKKSMLNMIIKEKKITHKTIFISNPLYHHKADRFLFFNFLNSIDKIYLSFYSIILIYFTFHIFNFLNSMGNSTNSFNQNFLHDWIQIDQIQSF